MSKWLISISECGKDWNKHITYIMMDFLSGTDVFTSNRKSKLEYVIQCFKTFPANEALEFITIKNRSQELGVTVQHKNCWGGGRNASYTMYCLWHIYKDNFQICAY